MESVNQNLLFSFCFRSIYNHVNDLIAQNEERPEQLARIYHDLQNINRHEVNADNTVDSTSTRRPLSRPSWGSMYDGVQDEADEDENDVSSSTFFKTAGNKKFNPVEHIGNYQLAFAKFL